MMYKMVGLLLDGRGTAQRRHRGVQFLGNGLVRVPHPFQNGFPQIGVAPEFGGYPQSQQEIGHSRSGVRLAEQGLFQPLGQISQPRHRGPDVTGLHHEISHTQLGHCFHHIIADIPGGSQDNGPQASSGGLAENGDAVQSRQKQVQHQNIWLKAVECCQCFPSIPAGTEDIGPPQEIRQSHSEFL